MQVQIWKQAKIPASEPDFGMHFRMDNLRATSRFHGAEWRSTVSTTVRKPNGNHTYAQVHPFCAH